jgi:putative oxidoreductase
MKYINPILATLLALPFVVFGPNYFLHFMATPPMDGDAGTFAGILYKSNFLLVVKIMEILFGFMILFNLKRPLALILIAPITVNIMMFEVLIAHKPGIGVVLVLLNLILLFRYKNNYRSIYA